MEHSPDAPPIPLWLRALSRLPLPVLYGITGLLVFVAHRLLRMKLDVVRENIAACFPDLDRQSVGRMVTGHYRHIGWIAAEFIRGATMPPQDFLDRVRMRNLPIAQHLLQQGRPVLLLAAHQGNWEWLLPALALQLGYPLDVGYKPIKSPWADSAMNAVRRRFGAHLVPAKELVADMLKRRNIVRGIALLADQGPTTSDHQHWVTFMGRDTAFYMGPEQMARAARYAAVFVALRRTSRGHYEIEFSELAASGEQLAPGEFTARYARLVEKEILAAPTDWTWGHRRWKLKRGLYAA